jgi:K+-sensing histidine kinase KdpD
LRHPIVRYGLALVAIVVAGLLRGLLGSYFTGVVPFATFFPAVLIAALLGGLGPGLLAAFLSALVGWFFWLGPPASLAAPTADVPINAPCSSLPACSW